MNNIFNLPPELIKVSLSNLSSQDLNDLFDLNNLFHPITEHNDAYLSIRYIAYNEYISRTNLYLSNIHKPNDPNYLSINQIRYFINHNIIIHPKSITINVIDDYETRNQFIKQLFQYKIIDYVNIFTTRVNLNLELFDDKDYIIQQLFDYIVRIQCQLNLFSFKYVGQQINSHPYNLSIIGLLQLRFRHIEMLSNHINSYDTMLTSLDLSFNGISDLGIISKFPESLTYLNLSNNNITSLMNHNFNWKSLINLQILDLSNNNIVYIDLSDSRNIQTYNLKELNLSSNNLTTIPKLSTSPLCKSLENLDLSRNLFSKLLYSFPSGLVKLNLKGNYFYDFYQQINGRIFPKSLEYLDLSYCHIPIIPPTTSTTTNESEFKQEIYNKLISIEKLQKLQWLQIDT